MFNHAVRLAFDSLCSSGMVGPKILFHVSYRQSDMSLASVIILLSIIRDAMWVGFLSLLSHFLITLWNDVGSEVLDSMSLL